MVGLTSLRTKNPPMLPKLNRRRAMFVLTKIDEILDWELRKEAERDTRWVDLGRYLCEVRAGQYWRLENLKSFDEFLARRFPESRRKAYYLMSIHEHLPPQARRELKEVGWTKGLELAKLARRDQQHFDCATWLHKAREMPKEDFKQEVEKELICADFLAGANLDHGSPEMLLYSITRFFKFLTDEQKQAFLEHVRGKAS